MNNSDNTAPKPISPANVPASEFFSIDINDTKIEVGIINYSDRLFIILTQFGKLGSLISVRRTTNVSGTEECREVFELKTLFGDERLEYHVTARTLAESISIEKPLLFSLALKDVTFPSVETIRKALIDHKIW